MFLFIFTEIGCEIRKGSLRGGNDIEKGREQLNKHAMKMERRPMRVVVYKGAVR